MPKASLWSRRRRPRMADLRSTVSLYLDMDHSLAKVASAKHISNNTVTYRVQKALSLFSAPGESTTDLRAALRIYEWLRGAPSLSGSDRRSIGRTRHATGPETKSRRQPWALQ